MRTMDNLAAADVDLVEAARRLLNAPVGRQRQLKALQQQCPVNAVMANHHDRVFAMLVEHETQCIAGARREVLQ